MESVHTKHLSLGRVKYALKGHVVAIEAFIDTSKRTEKDLPRHLVLIQIDCKGL